MSDRFRVTSTDLGLHPFTTVNFIVLSNLRWMRLLLHSDRTANSRIKLLLYVPGRYQEGRDLQIAEIKPSVPVQEHICKYQRLKQSPLQAFPEYPLYSRIIYTCTIFPPRQNRLQFYLHGCSFLHCLRFCPLSFSLESQNLIIPVNDTLAPFPGCWFNFNSPSFYSKHLYCTRAASFGHISEQPATFFKSH